MNIIELAKEAGFDIDLPSFKDGTAIALKFADLITAQLMSESASMREALKLAEEALEAIVDYLGWGYLPDKVTENTDKALAAIREALADQFRDATKMVAEPDDLDWITPEAVFEAKLAAHGIPNPTAEPVKQEPIAWACIDADGSFMDALDRKHGAYQTPLYAAPAQPVQEPVAWHEPNAYGNVTTHKKWAEENDGCHFTRKNKMSMRTTEIEVRDPNTDTIPLDVRFDPETQLGELSHYLVSQDGSEITITYAMAESLFSAVKRLEMCRPARVEETWQSNWKTEKPVLLPVSAEAIRAEALEEAAKFVEYVNQLGLETDCAAAIRGLK